MTRISLATLLVALSLALTACSRPTTIPPTPHVKAKATNPIVQAARDQLTNPASYSGAYYKIDYPMGDPPANRGACTDVVIRALRNGNIDLQQEIQDDAKKTLYPRMLFPDPNIDHRRCPNQIRWLKRHAKSVPLDQAQPGDIIFWKLIDDRDHVGIVSDQTGKSGQLKVIHNIGPHVSEDDALTRWKVVGLYRVQPRIQKGHKEL
jgi:uncharacterized protein YijF (DUF1287 family)